MYFHPKNLKIERNDFTLYCSLNPLWIPEDEVSVYSTWGVLLCMSPETEEQFSKAKLNHVVATHSLHHAVLSLVVQPLKIIMYKSRGEPFLWNRM